VSFHVVAKVILICAKLLQLLGEFVPQTPTGAPPLDPAGGLPSPKPPVPPPSQKSCIRPWHTHIKAQHNVSFWRRLCLSTPKLIRRVIYLASENTYANYFTRQKITHGLVFGAPCGSWHWARARRAPRLTRPWQHENIYGLPIP